MKLGKFGQNGIINSIWHHNKGNFSTFYMLFYEKARQVWRLVKLLLLLEIWKLTEKNICIFKPNFKGKKLNFLPYSGGSSVVCYVGNLPMWRGGAVSLKARGLLLWRGGVHSKDACTQKTRIYEQKTVVWKDLQIQILIFLERSIRSAWQTPIFWQL